MLSYIACDNGLLAPNFPGRREGGNNWDLILSWEIWGDPKYKTLTPNWSPGCDRICFNLYEEQLSGYEQALYIYDVASDSISKIPNTAPSPTLGVWSPDGSYIVYNSDMYLSVWMINPNGDNNKHIYGPPDGPGYFGLGGDWSPSGKELCFGGYNSESDSPNGLLIANVSDPGDITFRSINDDNDGYINYMVRARWSPGGDFLVYERQESETVNNEVCITTPRGGYFSTLIPAGNDYQQTVMDWSPDSRYLLLKISDEGYEDLWAFNIKTYEYIQLTFNDKRDSGIGWASWGANNKIIFDYGYYSQEYPGSSLTYIYSVDAPG